MNSPPAAPVTVNECEPRYCWTALPNCVVGIGCSNLVSSVLTCSLVCCSSSVVCFSFSSVLCSFCVVTSTLLSRFWSCWTLISSVRMTSRSCLRSARICRISALISLSTAAESASLSAARATPPSASAATANAQTTVEKIRLVCIQPPQRRKRSTRLPESNLRALRNPNPAPGYPRGSLLHPAATEDTVLPQYPGALADLLSRETSRKTNESPKVSVQVGTARSATIVLRGTNARRQFLCSAQSRPVIFLSLLRHCVAKRGSPMCPMDTNPIGRSANLARHRSRYRGGALGMKHELRGNQI